MLTDRGPLRPAPSARSSAELLDAARALRPRIEALGPEIEAGRELPAALVDLLHANALFRMLLPRSLGGHEVEPIAFVQVLEEIARADASTAWCICQASGCSMVSAYMDPASAHEAFGDPRAVLAWGQPVGARADATGDGGYRVNGQWVFASGSHHATWLGGITAPIFEADGAPRLLPSGAQEARTILFPAAQATLQDVWQVSGLRGTGSDTITVADLFVPEGHTARVEPATRREAGTLYRFTWGNLFSSGFSSVALGIARGLLDALVELASEKTPRGLRATLRENAVIQRQVAIGTAQLDAARALLHATLRDAWTVAEANGPGPLPMELRVRIRLAATFGIHQAMDVAQTAFHAAGSSAIFAANPFERRFRDLHAVSQQIQARQSHFETVGAYLLGLDPDPTFL
ncbi:MAG: acyl-CoA dehydrogenase family protein [Chloroflexi bacterium]|nr:acyl-CoA dehydrogenase family protein [Chloroflexota bacterium]